MDSYQRMVARTSRTKNIGMLCLTESCSEVNFFMSAPHTGRQATPLFGPQRVHHADRCCAIGGDPAGGECSNRMSPIAMRKNTASRRRFIEVTLEQADARQSR